MKTKLFLTLFILTMLISSVSFAIEFSDMDFSSYPATYKSAIEYLNGKGAINGYPDGTFAPTNSVTRAEIVKILSAAFDLNSNSSDNLASFSDVDSSKWYAPYIASAMQAGIIKGYEDNTFRPNNPVTYGELVTMILRIQNISVREATQGERWDTPYFEEASRRGFFNDYYTNDLVAPNNARRDNVALIVYNALTFNPASLKPTPTPTPTPTPEEELSKPTNTSINYIGVVGKTSREKGVKFVILDCFNQGKFKVEVTDEDKAPEQNSLIIFKVMTSGGLTLKKELKPEDVDKDYLTVKDIDEEFVSFKETNKDLDTTENSYTYDDKTVNLNKLLYVIVEASYSRDYKYKFSDAYELSKEFVEYQIDDRIIFDAEKQIAFIIRGID